MAAILSSRQNFYRKWYRKLNIPKRWPLAFRTFWAFDRRFSSNIDVDISISKFDPLCDLVTSPMTSWIRIYINVVIVSWYLCTGSLMMISLLIFFSYHDKCRYLICKGIKRADFEVTLWRHQWLHHHENFFLHNLGRSFKSEVKLKLCLIFQNFQNGRHFELATFFFYRKWYQKLNIPER